MSEGGAALRLGWTWEGAVGLVICDGAFEVEVEVALLSIDDEDGYCRRPAAAAALPACFDAPAPILKRNM